MARPGLRRTSLPQKNRPCGRLCGSKLTMDVACRNMMRHARIGIHQAFRLSSLNPARAVGLDSEVGSIALGKRADLVLVDDAMQLYSVWKNGEWIGGQPT